MTVPNYTSCIQVKLQVDLSPVPHGDVLRNQKYKDIFVYNKFEIGKISNFGKDRNEKDNKVEAIPYLFKLTYKLYISIHDNVSESVGLEKYIGGC